MDIHRNKEVLINFIGNRNKPIELITILENVMLRSDFEFLSRQIMYNLQNQWWEAQLHADKVSM